MTACRTRNDHSRLRNICNSGNSGNESCLHGSRGFESCGSNTDQWLTRSESDSRARHGGPIANIDSFGCRRNIDIVDHGLSTHVVRTYGFIGSRRCAGNIGDDLVSTTLNDTITRA